MRRARPFGDRRLADAGIADEQRIVLLAAAQHLDGAADLGLAPDQRIDLALARLLVEVDAIGLERVALLLGVVAGLGVGVLVDAAHRLALGEPCPLGDAVADVVDRVVAGHVLLLQEIGGVALALGEDRDQHVGAGHLLAARRLHMDDGALDHALEPGGRLGILVALGHQVVELGLDVGDEAALELSRGRRCRRASRRPRPGPRSVPAADAPAWRIRGDARSPARARGAGTARGCGRKLALRSLVLVVPSRQASALVVPAPYSHFFSITHCRGC
jgi:hypothetical protein